MNNFPFLDDNSISYILLSILLLLSEKITFNSIKCQKFFCFNEKLENIACLNWFIYMLSSQFPKAIGTFHFLQRKVLTVILL